MNMSAEPYDVAIAGLGAMGSAVAWSLAQRGRRVVGFDRFSPPHAKGSTHGRTRIIREGYFEHPLYVPLVHRAFARWTELERLSGRRLLKRTGGLMMGPPDGVLIPGTRASVHQHGLPHEELTAQEIRERFPAFAPADDMCGILERRAGILFPESCVQACLEEARKGGAVLHSGEAVEGWDAGSSEVEVRTSTGRIVRARHVVLATGAWMPEILGRLDLALSVERQVVHWLPRRDAAGSGAQVERGAAAGAGAAAGSGAAVEQVEQVEQVETVAPVEGAEKIEPIALWEYAPGRLFYTFPDLGDGVKMGIHHQGVTTDPVRIEREVSDEDRARAGKLVERFMPAAETGFSDSSVCMYTNTPDGHFVIDRHPDAERVIVVSACSGHGFKFASAIGDLVCSMVVGEGLEFDLGPFRLDRPALRC